MASMSSRGAELGDYYTAHSEFNLDQSGGDVPSIEDDHQSSRNDHLDRRTVHNVDCKDGKADFRRHIRAAQDYMDWTTR
jgi:hypothetical protein